MFHRFGRCIFKRPARSLRRHSQHCLKDFVLCECPQDSMAPHRLRAKAVSRVLRTLVAPFFAANAVETTDCHSPGRGFKSRRQRQTCCSSVRLERVPASPQALFQRFGRRIFFVVRLHECPAKLHRSPTWGQRVRIPPPGASQVLAWW